VSLDNNLGEQQLRDIALGRKNYLFAGSHDAARRGATLYSLMRTCAQYGGPPLRYLTDVLGKLARGGGRGSARRTASASVARIGRRGTDRARPVALAPAAAASTRPTRLVAAPFARRPSDRLSPPRTTTPMLRRRHPDRRWPLPLADATSPPPPAPYGQTGRLRSDDRMEVAEPCHR
jgi:hypothetical protein